MYYLLLLNVILNVTHLVLSSNTFSRCSGTVTILNQNIIDAGTNVQVSLESNTLFNMQRKTVLGLNWKYDFSDDLKFGETLMSLTEKPLTSKVDMHKQQQCSAMEKRLLLLFPKTCRC